MSDHWQDNLRKRMDLHEETAPEGLWKDIEQHVDTFGPVHIVKPRRKILIWSLSSVAVAAVAILMFLILPFNNQTSQISTENSIVFELSDQSNVVTSPEINEKNVIAESNERESASALKPVDEILFSQSRQTVVDRAQSNETEFMKIVEDDNVQSLETEISQFIPIYDELLNGYKLVENEVKTDNERKSKGKSQSLSKWQTNLSMSNVPSSSSETLTGFGTFAQQETVDNQYAFMSQYTRAETYTEIDHNLPIMVALTLRYKITQRLGVSSGLTYSLLSSKLRSESVNYSYDDHQTLHYLGLPLNMDYKLWQNKNFSTYISAGALVEKNIAGKLSSEYYIDNKLQSSTEEKIISKQLQWSFNSALGIEYRISDNFGIYAEPGVAYYFKNNSEIETIYKERPFNFNLRIGLRINFND